jgi:hypothetical protein
LDSEPEVEATTLLEYLCEQNPGRFADSKLRILQQRVKVWRKNALTTKYGINIQFKLHLFNL